jgi:hypothetical protein
MLPSEYVAQLRSARDDVDAANLAVLPGSPASTAGTRIFCGLLTDLDPGAPDLVATLEHLGRDVTARGGKPVVFVVDALIDGYGVGSSAPRSSVDAVMKFGAQGGCGLVLCEEIGSTEPTPWAYSADTVLELGIDARPRGRWLEVRKHRFAASVSGRHHLCFEGSGPPQVIPEPHAWTTGTAPMILRTHG